MLFFAADVVKMWGTVNAAAARAEVFMNCRLFCFIRLDDKTRFFRFLRFPAY